MAIIIRYEETDTKYVGALYKKLQLQQRPSQLEETQTLRNPINSVKLYPVVQDDKKLMGKEEQVILVK